MADFSKENNLSKFEKEFLSELLNDIEKRENSSWAKSWDFVETQNAFSGHKYSGMNDLFLELMSRARKLDDPRFATFNQARKNNYFIKKGSKGLPIQFFSFINKETNKQWNEKDFREKLKKHDWTVYKEKHVHIICSEDTILPGWAFLLIKTYLDDCKGTIIGNKVDLNSFILNQFIDNLNLDNFKNQRVIIKGCGKLEFNTQVYLNLIERLQPVVKSLMYGEACSTVPLYKKPRQ